MYYEKKAKQILIDNKGSFAAIFGEYNKKIQNNDLYFATWSEARTQVEFFLEKEIKKIDNNILKEKMIDAFCRKDSPSLQASPNKIRKSTKYKGMQNNNDETCDFDLLCYYIDRLNSEKCTKKMVKYNYKYCSKIIDEIIRLYNSILRTLKNKYDFLSKMNIEEYNNSTRQVLSLWDKVYSNEIKDIIDDEYDAVIKEVENQLNNDSKKNK